VNVIDEQFAKALKLHQAGASEEAERGYQNVLMQSPEHADAQHLLGVISYQQGKYDLAIKRIKHAIELRPCQAEYHVNLALH
jgi:Flp pilus assembly protein TadD